MSKSQILYASLSAAEAGGRLMSCMFHVAPAVGFNVQPVLVLVLFFVEVAEGEFDAPFAQLADGQSSDRGTMPLMARCMLSRALVSIADAVVGRRAADDARVTRVEREAIVIILEPLDAEK